MIRVSVICCIYNAFPLVKRCLESLLAHTPQDGVEIVLVDNHGPDSDARAYIKDLAAAHQGFIRFEDPGKNLGCHGGWNFGYSKTSPESAFVCKLDDDTEILTSDWAEKMSSALAKTPRLAYLSADIDAKQANVYHEEIRDGVKLEVADTGVIGFSLVMFRRQDVERWGPMKTGAYRAAGGNVIAEDRLYGGEEVYYASAARSENRIIAHFPSVVCHHMDNRDRDPDYVAWKMYYGLFGRTSKDLETWRNAGEHLTAYRELIAWEIRQRPMNEARTLIWVERVGQIGTLEHLPFIGDARLKTKNKVLQNACDQAIKSIEGRGR